VSLWRRFFAATYDRLMARSEKAGLRSHREALIGQAGGDVLEIGGGTGANLPFYRDSVATLTLTEPEEPMARRLERKVQESSSDARVLRAPAEELPFEDDSFDVAVSTLVLCTVEDQARALGELRRVLKPGGRLLFMEHVRSDEPRLARWQDRLNFVNRRVACGCNCNRRTVDSIRGAGFDVTELKQEVFPKGPPVVRPLVIGVAEADGASRDRDGQG
jgi:ubiquinone/menaquinone biosynthesis C-methylase UbiE